MGGGGWERGGGWVRGGGWEREEGIYTHSAHLTLLSSSSCSSPASCSLITSWSEAGAGVPTPPPHAPPPLRPTAGGLAVATLSDTVDMSATMLWVEGSNVRK